MAAAPVLAALDPVTRDLAPVRFAALVAGHTGAPLLVAAVYAADDVVERLAGGQLGEDLSADVSGAFAQARTVAAAAETLPLGATSAPRGLAFGAQEAGAALVVVGSPRATP